MATQRKKHYKMMGGGKGGGEGRRLGSFLHQCTLELAPQVVTEVPDALGDVFSGADCKFIKQNECLNMTSL